MNFCSVFPFRFAFLIYNFTLFFSVYSSDVPPSPLNICKQNGRQFTKILSLRGEQNIETRTIRCRKSLKIFEICMIESDYVSRVRGSKQKRSPNTFVASEFVSRFSACLSKSFASLICVNFYEHVREFNKLVKCSIPLALSLRVACFFRIRVSSFGLQLFRCLLKIKESRYKNKIIKYNN